VHVQTQYFLNIFDPWLVEFVDAEPKDKKDQLWLVRFPSIYQRTLFQKSISMVSFFYKAHIMEKSLLPLRSR
jgi:hypothetical protein